jgi:Zn-dependent M16 (insulinase) family peptidase
LLEQILLGNAASPLRKALIDSGLGSALCDGCGFDSENRDTLFVAGLKDVAETSAAKIERIVLDGLQDLADNGIDKELIESAIHQIEFHRKEITNTPYPYGIKLLLSFSGSWFHGGDPVKILNLDSDLEKIRRASGQGAFFEKKIKEYFLDNAHRILMTLVPDPRMAQEEDERVRTELDGIKERLSPGEVDKLRQDAAALQRLQETEEDISILPTLEREDVPPAVTVIKESDEDERLATTFYDQATSGIFYFAAAAGAALVPGPLVPLLPFFCYAFPKIGTSLHDYTEMARRIDAFTGGIGLSTNCRTRFDDNGACLPFVSFAGKCLNRNLEPMFEIIREMVDHFDFSDRARLNNLLREYRSAYESMIVHNGHRLAISLASRDFSATRALNEIWNGVHQFQFIKHLTQDLSDDKLTSIGQDLASIGAKLFNRQNFRMAFIGDSGALESARPYAESISSGFAAESDGFGPPDLAVENETIREAWSTSTAVSFVALAMPTVRMGHDDSAALSVISKLLRSMYLHREIREKGGAYGGFALYSPEDGLFSFASYRDPHVVTTLDVFTGAAEFIQSGIFNDEDVKEAVLQVCSEIDKPDPPGPTARKAFYRKIVSLSDDLRLNFKRRLIALNRDQVVAAAERYFGELPQKYGVAVISNEEKITAANEKLAGNPLQVHKI